MDKSEEIGKHTVFILNRNDVESAVRQFICSCYPEYSKGYTINPVIPERNQSNDGEFIIAASTGEPLSKICDRRYSGSNASLEEKEKMNIWDSVDQFIDVLNKMRAGVWKWYKNTTCKYVNLTVDMRDGGCLIFDKDGKRIDPKQLRWQYTKEKVL